MIEKRTVIKGTPIAGGIALGQARILVPGRADIPEFSITSAGVKSEIAALERAVEKTVAELRQLRDSAGKKAGGPVAKIFEAQLLIASDFEFLNRVKSEISKLRRNAGSIYNSLVHETVNPLRSSTDPYMRQMAQDVEAVTKKVLSHLIGRDQTLGKLSANTILVGKCFTPGDILVYRQRRAIGFVSSEGGADSHMALIARGLMLPVAVVDSVWTRIPDGCQLILDGSAGTIIIHPSEEDWQEHQRLKKRHGPALIRRIRKLPQIPPLTKDGKEIEIGANLSLPGPADDILSERKVPVGLYRTEFLFLAQSSFPDEETQYQYYDQIAEKFASTSVVLRTFDLGYDKLSPDTVWTNEDNPALGWRGIRPMLGMKNVFKTQIRAILRASTRMNIKILLPMITELSEVEKARRMISQVKFKLRQEGIDFDADIEVGIMIEVPSAAMTAETLATKVDFMSIGTNDLTQYTLAADRMNSRIAYLYNSFHPAVLNLIKMTVDGCRKRGIPVTICGEIAGDLLGLPLFVGMDIGMLSVHPGRIVDLCRAIRKIDSKLVELMVPSVLSSGSPNAVISKLERFQAAVNETRN